MDSFLPSQEMTAEQRTHHLDTVRELRFSAIAVAFKASAG